MFRKILLFMMILFSGIIMLGQHTIININKIDIPSYGNSGELECNPEITELEIKLYQNKIEIQTIDGSFYSFDIINILLLDDYSIHLNLSDDEGINHRMIIFVDHNVLC